MKLDVFAYNKCNPVVDGKKKDKNDDISDTRESLFNIYDSYK